MSYFHYIASNSKLETGKFGLKESKIETIERIAADKLLLNGKVECYLWLESERKKSLQQFINDHPYYENEVDAAGILVEELTYCVDGIKKYLKGKYIYELGAAFGHIMYFDGYKDVDKKCFDTLCDYIKTQLKHVDVVELLTVWAGEESYPLEEDIEVDVSDEKALADLKIKDKQYIYFVSN